MLIMFFFVLMDEMNYYSASLRFSFLFMIKRLIPKINHEYVRVHCTEEQSDTPTPSKNFQWYKITIVVRIIDILKRST